MSLHPGVRLRRRQSGSPGKELPRVEAGMQALVAIAMEYKIVWIFAAIVAAIQAINIF